MSETTTFANPPQQLASVRGQPRCMIQLRTVADFVELARVLYAGGVQPQGVSRAEHLVPIILTGWEAGFSVTQSIRWVMVNPSGNGCSVWGDGGLAIVMRSGQLVDRVVEYDGEPGTDDWTCIVRLHRKDDPKSFTREYSYSLGLAKKLKSFKISSGPWANDPGNMLYWRAMWRAMRREFADILAGLSGVEEEDEVITAEVVSKPPQLGPAGEPVEMIDEEQLEEIVRLRGLAEDAITDESRMAEAWAEHLKPFGVNSARDLTQTDATKLIAVLTETYDPFTSPPQSTA
jgi:hypothetical protein